MINSIKQAIVNKLLELYPSSTIYDEDIPQNFKKPSFLIALTDQYYSKILNIKYKSLLSFDVAYFSNKEVTEIKANCLDVQLNLFRGFDLIGNYRAFNKQAIITDNVLHFTFDISYEEINLSLETKMQQPQINTNL